MSRGFLIQLKVRIDIFSFTVQIVEHSHKINAERYVLSMNDRLKSNNISRTHLLTCEVLPTDSSKMQYESCFPCKFWPSSWCKKLDKITKTIKERLLFNFNQRSRQMVHTDEEAGLSNTVTICSSDKTPIIPLTQTHFKQYQQLFKQFL